MKNSPAYRQPWLRTPVFDGLYILFPGFAALLACIFLPVSYKQTDQMPLAGWVILVLFIDVAHVYSTLFRTYWDKQRFARHRSLYIAVPLACYGTGVLLYSFDGLVFWRVLAYLAVFHFIRQQYGFMRLYSRFEPKSSVSSKVDAIAVYAATLYPLIYWHCTPGRNFNWFVEGDFIIGYSLAIKEIAFIIYLLIIAAYLIKETSVFITSRQLNIPKNLVIGITFLSWYFGIVYFNGDMAFTLLNVVAHGIPYIALIWLFRQKESALQPSAHASHSSKYTLLIFLFTIVAFAYFEEGLWDGLVWREHGQVFGVFQYLPSLNNKEVLSVLIPLLSLPQSTHYVLDGFIWKKENKA